MIGMCFTGGRRDTTGIFPGVLVFVDLDDGQLILTINDVIFSVRVIGLDVEAGVVVASEDVEWLVCVRPLMREPLDTMRNV